MSGPETSFRLLDDRQGWDPRAGDGLVGVRLDDGGLRLAAAGDDGHFRQGEGSALARSRDGTWWLGTRAGLLRLAPCDAEFHAWHDVRGVHDLTARGGRLGVIAGSGRVQVLDTATGRLLAEAWVTDAFAVEIAGDGSIRVTDRRGRRTGLDPSGLVCTTDPPCGPGQTLQVPPTPRPWPPGVTVCAEGFALPGRGAFDWSGRTRSGGNSNPVGDSFAARGQFLSAPLDSGIPGCHWHRIQLDADMPEGTAMQVSFATTDGPVQGRVQALAPPGDWADFPAGDPHPSDWFTVREGAVDSTLGAAPGRYGYLRVRLTGNGHATPVVHQIRIDLPRSTSLELLPAVYSEDPQATDFTERFLSVFDAELELIDEVLARRSTLLDADALPDDALGWLAGLLGTGFEPEMPVANRRAFLRAAPDLSRRRGTPQGLVDTLQIALGVSSTVEELGAARPWGAVGEARLGSVRLFSRSTARVRLGTSRLGLARLKGRGNPDHDAVLAGAHRIRVHVPSDADTGLVARVVRTQLPAHVAFTVESSAPGFGMDGMRVGVNTVLTAPPPTVVGDITLGRRGVVSPGRAKGAALVVGRTVLAGATASEEREWN